MIIKILGSGCQKCVKLGENARTAVEAAGQQAEIVKVTDIVEIAAYGLLSTPGLVINDQLVSSGKVLSAQEIGGLL